MLPNTWPRQMETMSTRADGSRATMGRMTVAEPGLPALSYTDTLCFTRLVRRGERCSGQSTCRWLTATEIEIEMDRSRSLPPPRCRFMVRG